MLLFDADGNQLEERQLAIGAAPRPRTRSPGRRYRFSEDDIRDRIMEQLGAEPADIRIKGFDFSNHPTSMYPYSPYAEEMFLGCLDFPDDSPDEESWLHEFGCGGEMAIWGEENRGTGLLFLLLGIGSASVHGVIWFFSLGLV